MKSSEPTPTQASRPVSRWKRLLTPRVARQPQIYFDTAAEMEAWITDWIASKLHLPPAGIGVETPFTDFGMDSMAAVELSGRLEEVMGRHVSPSAAWEYPNVRELAVYLLSGAEAELQDMDL
jgi:acyl carrier protein